MDRCHILQLMLVAYLLTTGLSISLLFQLLKSIKNVQEQTQNKKKKQLHNRQRRDKVVIETPLPISTNVDANPLNSPTLFDEHFTDQFFTKPNEKTNGE